MPRAIPRALAIATVTAVVQGCADRPAPTESSESGALAASVTAPGPGAAGRPSVLVNPNANDNGTAKSIQEGIDMVAPGGKVLVLPGTYPEAIVIRKGLTLEAIGGKSGPVVVAPPVAAIAVEVGTTDPVIIRGLTIHTRAFGIRGVVGVAENVTVEQATIRAIDPPLGFSALIDIANDAPTSARGRLVVRESFLDGGVSFARSLSPPLPMHLGITVTGDVDARLEGNVIRRTGGGCVVVQMRNDFAGEMNVDIVDNDVDECYGRVGAIVVGPSVPLAPPLPPVTATGTVNIVGNTIRNTPGSCLRASAVFYEFYTGQIERNRILGVVQSCAAASARGLPGGIWVGSLRGIPAATPVVRFNDIVGNAHAGLRVAANITAPLDARCNWWSAVSGPSGAGTGSGDAVVVQAGAATPMFTPFATAPIAETGRTSC